jgi:hypothetical protein
MGAETHDRLLLEIAGTRLETIGAGRLAGVSAGGAMCDI